MTTTIEFLSTGVSYFILISDQLKFIAIRHGLSNRSIRRAHLLNDVTYVRVWTFGWHGARRQNDDGLASTVAAGQVGEARPSP